MLWFDNFKRGGPSCDFTISRHCFIFLVLGFNGKIAKSQDGAISRKDRQITGWGHFRDFTSCQSLHTLSLFHFSSFFCLGLFFSCKLFFFCSLLFIGVNLGDMTSKLIAPYSKNFVHQFLFFFVRTSFESTIKRPSRAGSTLQCDRRGRSQ